MKPQIAKEPFSLGLYEEILPLAQLSWEDNSKEKGKTCSFYLERDVQIDPDLGVYQALEAAGRLIILTLRDNDRLVGYTMAFTYPSPHHRHIMCGNGDSIYLYPRYQSYAAVLVAMLERELLERGARIFGWPVSQDGQMFKVLSSLGFAGDEVVMEKKLCVQ